MTSIYVIGFTRKHPTALAGWRIVRGVDPAIDFNANTLPSNTSRVYILGSVGADSVERIERSIMDGLERGGIAISTAMRIVSVESELDMFRRRWKTLSHREEQVLSASCYGEPRKSIAARIGSSPRTLEIQSRGGMSKLGSRHLPAVAHRAIRAGLLPPVIVDHDEFLGRWRSLTHRQREVLGTVAEMPYKDAGAALGLTCRGVEAIARNALVIMYDDGARSVARFALDATSAGIDLISYIPEP